MASSHPNRTSDDRFEFRHKSQKVWVDRTTNDVILRLHETDIVRVRPNGDVTLSTGGWATHKTLQSMNDALWLFGMFVGSTSEFVPQAAAAAVQQPLPHVISAPQPPHLVPAAAAAAAVQQPPRHVISVPQPPHLAPAAATAAELALAGAELAAASAAAATAAAGLALPGAACVEAPSGAPVTVLQPLPAAQLPAPGSGSWADIALCPSPGLPAPAWPPGLEPQHAQIMNPEAVSPGVTMSISHDMMSPEAVSQGSSLGGLGVSFSEAQLLGAVTPPPLLLQQQQQPALSFAEQLQAQMQLLDMHDDEGLPSATEACGEVPSTGSWTSIDSLGLSPPAWPPGLEPLHAPDTHHMASPGASSTAAASQETCSAEHYELDKPEYKTDEFMLYQFKIKQCTNEEAHDWTLCPFAHPGEKAQRRDPRLYKYTSISCPDWNRKGKCKRGTACPYAHGKYELWLHPSRYKTETCKDAPHCTCRVCFFAHALEEVRTVEPEDLPVLLEEGGAADAELPAVPESASPAPKCGSDTSAEAAAAAKAKAAAAAAAEAAAAHTLAEQLQAHMQQLGIQDDGLRAMTAHGAAPAVQPAPVLNCLPPAPLGFASGCAQTMHALFYGVTATPTTDMSVML
ncbi:hypothetical protein OEZ86_001699 [Tetradesmus obliquus]|nr:hypothetical protein OEZ86_001699 [Tetradesmus obliquus]